MEHDDVVLRVSEGDGSRVVAMMGREDKSSGKNIITQCSCSDVDCTREEEEEKNIKIKIKDGNLR